MKRGWWLLKKLKRELPSVQFSSVAQSCPTLCDPMNCSTSGSPVRHYLPEFTQAHAHWVDDAIQPSHPLSSSSLPAFHFSQHQGLFQWVGSLYQVANILELQFQHQSFQGIFRVGFPLGWTGWSPCSPRDSQESSPAPQFESISSSVLSLLYGPALTSVHDYWETASFICIHISSPFWTSFSFNILQRKGSETILRNFLVWNHKV